MKKILLLTFFITSIFFINAQPKPAPKPAAAPAVKKPSGPSPYVLKKDYDSLSTSLKSQVKSLQGTVSSLRGAIGSKDQQIADLSEQMKKVEEVLNSTNFKISLTSDSLNKTRTSVEEVQTEARNSVSELKALNEKLHGQIVFLWVFAAVILGLSIFVWFSANKQIKAVKDAAWTNQHLLENKLAENKQAIEEQVKNLENKIITESRNAQHYSERQANALKDNLQNMNDFVNGLKDDVQALAQTVQSLKDKEA